jgi:hypothetical protein
MKEDEEGRSREIKESGIGNILVVVRVPELPLPRALDSRWDEGKDHSGDDAGHGHDTVELMIWLWSTGGELTACGTQEDSCWNSHGSWLS